MNAVLLETWTGLAYGVVAAELNSLLNAYAAMNTDAQTSRAAHEIKDPCGKYVGARSVFAQLTVPAQAGG